MIREYGKHRNIKIWLRFSDGEYLNLLNRSKKNDISMSDIIRHALKKHQDDKLESVSLQNSNCR